MTNKPRNVGVMVENSTVSNATTHMADAILNANYKMIKARGIKPNDDGEYLDEDGESILMEEETIKAIIKDSIDSTVVATDGNTKGNIEDFSYYLIDAFPNVADVIQQEPHVLEYLTNHFNEATKSLALHLAPAINDLAEHGQSVARIETFNHDRDNTFYIVKGEEDETAVVETKSPTELRMLSIKEEVSRNNPGLRGLDFDRECDRVLAAEQQLHPEQYAVDDELTFGGISQFPHNGEWVTVFHDNVQQLGSYKARVVYTGIMDKSSIKPSLTSNMEDLPVTNSDTILGSKGE